jgi:predicted AAA+ superfamily ATPase
MPHQRPRSLLPLFAKRLKLSPVLGLVGARQTGKSTFLRDLLASKVNLRYVSLDRRETRLQAEKAPGPFIRLEQKDKTALCIDEIQKVPDLFDEVKAEVDEDRRPGRYILSGSTEFSKKTGIRESLTGRIITFHMYPMTLAELFPGRKKPLTDTEVHLALTAGGLPGICFIRDADARHALFQSWLETLIYKDLLAFNIPKFNADSALSILETCARLGAPTLSEISKELEVDPRRIRHYLDAFLCVFTLYKLTPYKGASGKDRYCLFDSGLATHLGASLISAVLIRFINDFLASSECVGVRRPRLHSYQTPRGSHLHLVVESSAGTFALLIRDSQTINAYALRGPQAFRKKHPKCKVYILAPGTDNVHAEAGIEIVPWKRMQDLMPR